MSDRRPISKCQRRLLTLWGLGGAIALAIVIVQTAPGGAYASHAGELLDWFLPTVIPTISLMVGTVMANLRAPDKEATVDQFTYRLVFWLSVLYLLLVIGVLLLYAQSPTPVADLKGSGRLVTALYSIVGVALGALFVSKASARSAGGPAHG